MRTTSRRLALLSAAVVAAAAGISRGAEPFLTVNDFAIAIDAIPSFFIDDTAGGGTSSMYPIPQETPSMMFDGDLNTKFLNFGRRGAGFIVTAGTSTARSFRLSTANDAPERDPTSYVLLGTNSSIISEDRSNGLGGEAWTVIQSGTVALPTARNTNGPVIDLGNNTAYSSYKLYFPSLRQPGGSANSMQLSEVQLWDQAGGAGNALLNSGQDVRAIDNPGPESSYNTGERPQQAFDRNVNTKYRNALNGANGNQDGHAGAGLIVTPKRGQTILQSFQIATANDFPVRDPTSYEIYGTNAAINSADNSDGTGEAWTLISSGSLSLPSARLTFGSVIPLSNTTAYNSYKVVFPSTGARNSMQISELKFVGDLVSPSEWLTNANGDWNNPDNWIGELPNGVGKTARLFNKSTSSHTIFTETAITLGTLRIENSSPYQITGAGSLTMQVSSGAASINVSGATHKINVPMTIASNTTITVAGGATLKISDPVTVNAGKSITQSGNIIYESTVDVLPGAGIGVQAGGGSPEMNVLKLRENANGTLAMGGNSALRANALLLDGSARLDVDNNGVVTGTAKATVQSLVASSRNGNASARWSSPGITSAFARGHAATGLAVLSGDQYQSVGGTAFMGQSFSANETLVKHTWNGDTDLDGAVTFTDYSRVDAGFQNGGNDWFHGDFSYDGLVNFDDYALIDGAFQVQNGTIGRALMYLDGSDRSDNGMSDPGLQLVQQHFAQFGDAYAGAFMNAVPEPSSALALTGLAALAATRRRRRKLRRTMLTLGAALGMPVVAQTSAQAAAPAVNFHYAHNYAAGGGAPNYADIVYVGQGAYNDPGNNLWNGFGPGFTADTGPNNNAGGAGTPVTLNVNFGAANGGLWFDGPDGVGGNSHQGTPFFLLGYASLVNSANPGAGSSASPLGTFALNNVPSGTYDVYLYGANYDSDRGAQFTLNSGTAEGGLTATLNNHNNNSFVLGENYVRFNNVTPNGSGVISGSFAPILNPNTGSTGEANFNAIQIVFTGDGSEWNVDSPGDWQTTGNWRGVVPNGVGAAAIFGDRISTAHTVLTDTAQTLGTIRLENASTYVLGGNGSITVQVAAGSGSINVSGGTQKINVPMTFASNTSINSNAGATLKISDPVTINSGVVVTQTASAGQVKFESIVNVGANSGLLMRNTQNMNALNLAAGGNATLSVNGSTVLKTENLSVSGTSRLDLADNDMIVENATYAGISTLIRTARNGGAWNQPGITSSSAASANPKNKTLGTITGAEFHTAQGAAATFGGFNVANTDIVVKYTYYGDADLNGQVNFDDYSRIDGGFNNHRTGWFNGDFDYSGTVDFDDYSLIDNAFNTQGGTLRRAMTYLDGSDRSHQGMDTPALQFVMDHFAQFGQPYANGFLNAVPEPTSAMVFAGFAAVASGRRRRRTRQPK